MGWRSLFLSQPVANTPEIYAPPPPVLGPYGNRPPVGSDLASWETLVGLYAGASVSRAEAIRVPAVKAARDAICDLGAILPLQGFNGSGERVQRSLLTQPEKLEGLTKSRTWSGVLDDLFFTAECLLMVTDRDWTTYPTAVLRIPYGRWNVEPDGSVRVDSKRINTLDAIVFRSPRDGLLKAGAPTIRALLALEARAAHRVANPQARSFFRSRSGVEYSDAEIDGFLAANKAQRHQNVDGWLPADVERIEVRQPTAAEEMLLDQQNFGILQIARLTGVSPHRLAAPTTDDTYQNVQDDRAQLVELVAAPLLRCVEERLSLGDVTPAGQVVKWNYDAFLRPRTLDRYQAHSVALAGAPFKTVNEERALESLPPIAGGDVLPSMRTAPGVSDGS